MNRYELAAKPVDVTTSAGVVQARLECRQCGGHDSWRIAGRKPPPDILTKHFTNKGWAVGRRAICPECAARKPEPKKEIEMASVTPIKVEPAPSADLKAMKLKATEHLIAYFDMDTGQYDSGWSDERVAKESGMPLAWVSKRREEDYGPLREPSEFAAFRAEAKNLASEIGKLQAKLEAMSKRNGWAA